MIFKALAQIAIWIILAPAPSYAQSVTDGVLINAKFMDRDLEKRTVKLEGNVQIVFQGQHLSCDKATLDLKNQKIIAVGKVIMYSDKTHVEGDKVEFNYQQNTGIIYNGFVQSGQVVFQGDIIEKVGPDRYLATNGEFTACETCPPGWSFSGRKIDAEMGGYARIRRPVFRVGGVPIFILPSIIVPLKSSRQSGFLVPNADVSKKGGFALSESYFWAISRSQDLTTAVKWYDLRGWKADGDYRYVVSEHGKGNLKFGWFGDRSFQRSLQNQNFDNEFQRWKGLYSHYHDMPNNYVHRMDLNLISDLRYPREFPEEMKGHGDPAIENKMSITKSGDDHYISAEADVYRNLLKTHPLANNDDSVHRVPELRYSLKEKQLWENGPLFRLDTNFVSFARDGYNYDDLDPAKTQTTLGPQGEIKRDGQFDEDTDIFRTGQRFDIKPALTYPFQIAKRFDVVPSVLFRNTQYKFYPTDGAEAVGFSDSAARSYLQTDFAIRTELSRVWGNLDDPKGIRWKHSIEPEVGYSQIPWSRKPNHPFFGDFEGLQYSRQFDTVSDTDIGNDRTGIQFDYEDRTYERRVVNFGIAQRFTRKFWQNDVPEYRTAVLFKLGQSYDFKEAESRTPHPWSNIDSLLDMRFEHFETYTVASYNTYAKVTNLSTRVKFLLNPSNYVFTNYTRNFIVDEDYRVRDETRNVSFGAGVSSKYVEASGQVDMLARTFEVTSWTYRLGIRPPGKCWNIRFEHRQVVGSDDPQIKASAAFEFGGENTGQGFTN